MLRATVSGSFHRHMTPIYEAVGNLRAKGVDVLSPADPRVVDYVGEFLFVASDRLRSVKLVQDRHLEAIRASDFLLVVCPDGYTGASTSMEIGFARACGVPTFSTSPANDITLREYVQHVDTITSILPIAGMRRGDAHARRGDHLLLSPRKTVESLHEKLDGMLPYVEGSAGNLRDNAEAAFRDASAFVRRALAD